MTAQAILAEMQTLASKDKAAHLLRFFKTGKGEYAEGDLFLGIVVPETRRIAKKYKQTPLSELSKALTSPYHEIRLCALLILVEQYRKGSDAVKEQIIPFYLKHTKSINNWDLVDLSAPYIIGEYLLDKDRDLLFELAKSEHLWERRIAIISMLTMVRNNDFTDAIALIEILKHDSHDLIHKAMGWVLREMGKKDRSVLVHFLDTHAETLPRTTLRYSIEHFPEEQRLYYLRKRKA